MERHTGAGFVTYGCPQRALNGVDLGGFGHDEKLPSVKLGATRPSLRL